MYRKALEQLVATIRSWASMPISKTSINWLLLGTHAIVFPSLATADVNDCSFAEPVFTVTTKAKVSPLYDGSIIRQGQEVDIHEGIAVVSIPGTSDGLVHVYESQNPATWRQVTTLRPNSPAVRGFGRSLSLANDTLIVGSSLRSEPGSTSGAVHVYRMRHDDPSSWEHVQTLMFENENDFSLSVAISGDCIVVGAPSTEDGRGAAFLFERDVPTGEFTQRARLTSDDLDPPNFFGNSVAVDQETVAIGAKGKAYIFAKDDDGDWARSATLLPFNGLSYDRYESIVALEGNVVVVGVDVITAIFVYEKDWPDVNRWGGAAVLVPGDDHRGRSDFGESVAISNNHIAAGVQYDPGTSGISRGAVYVYRKNSEHPPPVWEQVYKWVVDEASDHDFIGASLAMQENILLATAPGVPNGSVYVVELETRANTAPSLQASEPVFLTPIDEDASFVNRGTFISNLLANLGAHAIDDVDDNRFGIAVISVDNAHGTWQFDPTGQTDFRNFDEVSEQAARLLAPQAVIRFVPNTDYNGIVASGFTFRAWDQPQSKNGLVENIVCTGGATPYSSGSGTAGIEIVAIEDPPRLVLNRTLSVKSGETAAIDESLLRTVDPEGEIPENVRYVLTALPARGVLTVSGRTLTVDDSFSQEDIDQRQVRYFANDGVRGNQQFRFFLQDSGGAMGEPQTYHILIDFAVKSKIVATDVLRNDQFGQALSMSDNVLVIGSVGDDDFKGAAYVFEREGVHQPWNQTAKLTIADGEPHDRFGAAVSIDGETIVVGAFLDDDQGISSGSAYVFERDDGQPGEWRLIAKLVDANGEFDDLFGSSVGISGDTIIVGAPNDNGLGDRSGSVHVFERDAGGGNAWGHVATISNPGAGLRGQFGISITISGDHFAVGSMRYQSQPDAIYVYRRASHDHYRWERVTSIVGISPYGAPVDMDGDTLVVGAVWDNVNAEDAGSAYVFERNAGGPDQWGLVTKLRYQCPKPRDGFGDPLAIDGDVIATASRYGCDTGARNEAIVIFERHAGGTNNWGETAALVPDDIRVSGFPIISVAVEGNMVVAGMPHLDGGVAYEFAITRNRAPQLTSTASATVFDSIQEDDLHAPGNTIAELMERMEPGTIDDNNAGIFGIVVTAVNSQYGRWQFRLHDQPNWIDFEPIVQTSARLLGTGDFIRLLPRQDFSGDAANGITFRIWDLSSGVAGAVVDASANGGNTAFSEIAATAGGRIDPASDAPGLAIAAGLAAEAGESIVIDPSLLTAVDADGELPVNLKYTITTEPTLGTLRRNNVPVSTGQSFTQADIDNGLISFVANGDAFGIGSFRFRLEDSTGASSEIFAFAATVGLTHLAPQVAKLTPADGSAGDLFGFATAIDGAIAVIGAWRNDENGEDAGAAYVYERENELTDAWRFRQKLVPSDGKPGDFFGFSVAVHENTIVVGALLDDAPNFNSGSAYVFARGSGLTPQWNEVAKLTAEAAEENHFFGRSVAIDDSTIVVGAAGDEYPSARSMDAVYVYERVGDGDDWIARTRLTLSDANVPSGFGFSVAVGGDVIVVGAFLGHNDNIRSGSAYLFQQDDAGSGEWRERRKLAPADGADNDWFGYSVSIDGDLIVVGSPRNDEYGLDAGGVYLFDRNMKGRHTPEFGLLKKLGAARSPAESRFGHAVDIDRDVVVIGAPESQTVGPSAGSVFVFERNLGGVDAWGIVAEVVGRDTAGFDTFGTSVSVRDGSMIVGACLDDDGGENLGSAYMFRLIHQSPPTISYSLNLNQGWNLISCPMVISRNIVDLFGDLVGGEAWCWSDDRYQAVEMMQPTWGLWFYSVRSAAIEMTGTELADPKIYLHRFWNLIGATMGPLADDRGVVTTEVIVDPFVRPILTWDNGRFQPVDELVMGQGYWVYRPDSETSTGE